MEAFDDLQDHKARRTYSPAWIAAGVVALLVLGLLGSALLADPAQPPQVGGPVPDFALVALDGTPMSLSAHQGQVVVLNYFASWCPPCRQEAADLEQTWRNYQDQDVQFLGIAYQDAAAKAQAFLDEFDVTYPCAAESSNRTARLHGVTGVPETFIVDRQGNLVRHFLGPITREELSREIDLLLNP